MHFWSINPVFWDTFMHIYTVLLHKYTACRLDPFCAVQKQRVCTYTQTISNGTPYVSAYTTSSYKYHLRKIIFLDNLFLVLYTDFRW